MSNLLSLLPASGWQRLLCDFVWQSTLIAALAWLLLRLFIRQPSARAGLCLLALVACALVPLASLAARNSGWTLWQTPTVAIERDKLAANPDSSLTDQSGDATIDRPAIELNPSDRESNTPPEAITSPEVAERPHLQTGSEPQAEALAEHIDSTPPANINARATASIPTTIENRFTDQKSNWKSHLLPAIGIVWLCASIALFVRLFLSLIATNRLVRSATPCESSLLLAAASDAARRTGLKQSPRLLVSQKVATPMVCALGTPYLLVPSAVAVEEGASDRKHDWVAAFTHELAHVARGDGWSRLAVEVVVSLLPLQPLVWRLRALFHTACEEACDDRAVSHGISPLDLADALANWTTAKRPAAMLAAIGMSSNKARILRLVSMQKTPQTYLNRLSLWTALVTCLVLSAALAMAQTKSDKDGDQVKTSPIEESRQPMTNAKASQTKTQFYQRSLSETESLFLNFENKPKEYYRLKPAGTAVLRLNLNSKVTLQINLPSTRIENIEPSTDEGPVTVSRISAHHVELVAKKIGETRISVSTNTGNSYTFICIISNDANPGVLRDFAGSDSRSTNNVSPGYSQYDLKYADDPLIQLYTKQLAATQTDWEQVKSGDTSENDGEFEKSLRKRIFDLKERIEKRKAELAAAQPKGASEKTSDGKRAVAGNPLKNASPNDAEIEKRLQDDPLIELYSSQRAATEKELKELKPDEPNATFVDRIESLADRIEKRKAEIRPRIAEELAAEAANKKTDASDNVQSVASTKQYVIEPPDIVTIDIIQLSPKKTPRILPMDKVRITVDGTINDKPIAGVYQVDSSGEVVLGPVYGAAKISGLTRREAETAVRAKLEDTLAHPEVALVLDESRYEKAIAGQHLVGPDGTINLGKYGQVQVAGMTIPQTIQAIEDHLSAEFAHPQISLDVSAHNSKVYYVIVGGGQAGDNIFRFPITGNESALDAIAQLKLSGVSKAHIFIARPQQGKADKTINISWTDLISGKAKENFQLQPGDRLFFMGASYDHSGDAPKWDENANEYTSPSKISR